MWLIADVEPNRMSTKVADWAMIFSILGLVVVWGFGVGHSAGSLNESLEVPLGIIGFSSAVIFILFTFFCLGHAIDMKKGTEKNLWIIGLLFATPIVVPYFYFKFISKMRRKVQPDDPDDASEA